METNGNRPGRKLKCASRAEILRSHQRDDDFIKFLREKLSDILQNIGVHRTLLQYIRSDIPFKLLYFIFTSGMGNQTLGEEYTGIVQANLEQRKVPTLTVRILAAILECFGERTLLKLLQQLQAYVNHPLRELTPAAIMFLNTLLSKLRTMIPIIILFHKGIFYVYGRYYSLGRRIAGLDYTKIYGPRPKDTVSWGLRLLGFATIIQCLLKIWQSGVIQDTAAINTSNSKYISHNCQLCLEATATTATLCGHLFCWSCLSEWLRVKPQCPYCREYVPPSRIVHLMNL
ncbi:PREDICTED: peroxisome biogenesis factor 10-like [Cyphomyrmex costatus]|uniref:RING-type E3 ubiquitin transferase n=1 Tax=Cyphomyrmex costatus TaxID=456900 RepID=A0A195CR90_9HYME|nr:PREDICTED: peroxisome biogenesis factor 10-like [Cyphomyrmex costatus]KYN03012.1 Peroxisome biogenesis factor 10 [Cyphomyrmex costatus]